MLKSIDGISLRYAYIDSDKYLADQISIKHKVTVKFIEEHGRPGDKYCIITCKVRKRDAAEFEKALSELPNKMLIMGNTDYEEFCEEMAEVFDSKTA